jgi:hypothetical protein
VTVSRAPGRLHSANLERNFLTGPIVELLAHLCAIVAFVHTQKELGCATHRHDPYLTNGFDLRFVGYDDRR